jgi:hypothetical protein
LPISADLLLDTSAAIALVAPTSDAHAAVMKRTRGATLGLAGHAAFETYSVLTRLPGALRLNAAGALSVIEANFPASAFLTPSQSARALQRWPRRAWPEAPSMTAWSPWRRPPPASRCCPATGARCRPIARYRCGLRWFDSSFPRRRESRRRIHLPAITKAHWIPACAGMTKFFCRFEVKME